MRTKRIEAKQLEDIGTILFDACGSPHDESKIVSEVLVRSTMMGHSSHGIVRFAEYMKLVQQKLITPGAKFEIILDTPGMAVVNGNFGWGQLTAQKAMMLAIQKAREVGVGTVVVRNCAHVGRLGEYSVMPVKEGMIGTMYVNTYGSIDRMVPWGGIEPRLSPNPLSWAIPTGLGWPLLVDITTSVIPEGKVRVALQSGVRLPEGVLIDSTGHPTTNPADLYDHGGGGILPMGGIVGHKGYGLNLVAELFAGALSGAGCRGQATTRIGNGIFIQVLDIHRLIPLQQFIDAVQRFIVHVKSSKPMPDVEEVLIPGEIEYRALDRSSAEGVSLNEGIWDGIKEAAESIGVAVPVLF